MTGPAVVGSPVVAEDAESVALLFDDGTLHSRMLRADPGALVLEYSRLVMGFLLFRPLPERIAMIGLGGGSIARYCAARLPETDFTAVELSPAVVALRDVFRLPPDGARFRVVVADGAVFVARDQPPLDVLIVDGFDAAGQPEQLCSLPFYEACRRRLAPGGVLVVNLYADDGGFERCLDRVWHVFDGRIAVAEAGESANNLVFAGTSDPFPPPFTELLARARTLGGAHPVDLERTVRKLAARGLDRWAAGPPWPRTEETAARRPRGRRPRERGTGRRLRRGRRRVADD